MADIQALRLNLCQRILSIVALLERSDEAGFASNDSLYSSLLCLDQLVVHVVGVVHLLPEATASTVLSCLRACLECLQQLLSDAETPSHGYCAPTLRSAGGRPKFDITERQIEYFLEMDFTAPEMAEMLGVSVRTIRRRMSEYGLTIRASYTQLSDAQLDEHVRALKRHFPDAGYRCILGLLRSSDIRVPVRLVREAVARCDPNGVCLRWIASVHRRRTYSVFAPLALWHIDGNHKLIRSHALIHYLFIVS